VRRSELDLPRTCRHFGNDDRARLKRSKGDEPWI
jgi:hypothetical protein